MNNLATLTDPNTIQLSDKNGNIIKTVKAKFILIAVGGRPNYGDFPGKEHCISSDDIFWLNERPGHTLVVGASYIALECAGFLHATKNPVAVMMRSIPLRGFD